MRRRFGPVSGSFGVLALSMLLTTECKLISYPPAGQRPVEKEADAVKDPSPAVRPPVAPRISESNIATAEEGKKVKQWKPGDPVRVMNDLKKSDKLLRTGDKKPTVRKPVSPQSVDRNLANVPPLAPPGPDAPVRVIDDLKTDPKDSPGEEPADPDDEKKPAPKP